MSETSPRWTFIFIAGCVVAFVLQRLVGVGSWIFFSFIPLLALQSPWMFITSIFLHADFSHLFFNMFALFFFGIYLERLIGGRRFALLFLASGVVGNVGYMLTAANPLVPAIGASGAVYGIMGTLAVLTPTLLVFVYGIPLPMIAAAVIWTLLDFIGLFAPTGIAHGAHLGGMFLGAAYGLYLRLIVARGLRIRH